MSRPRMEWTMETVRARCDEIGECLIWRGAMSSGGAPTAKIDGKMGSVRRHVYTHIMGKTILPGRIISPACRNPRCLGDQCLKQITRATLQHRTAAEMSLTPMGRRTEQQKAVAAGFAKLNAAQAAAIRQAATTNAQEAALRAVNISTIRRIRQGKSWAPLFVNSVFNLAA